MKYIAFDLGASSGKMMLGSFDGNRLDTEVIHRFPNCQISANGSLYWNFLGIYQNLIEGLRTGIRKSQDWEWIPTVMILALLEKAETLSRRCTAIGTHVQRETGIKSTT